MPMKMAKKSSGLKAMVMLAARRTSLPRRARANLPTSFIEEWRMTTRYVLLIKKAIALASRLTMR